MNETEKRLDARLVTSIVAAGLLSFSGVVVETAMNVTFPTLMTEFGITTGTVQWITTGYLLVLALVIPTSSYLRRTFPLRGLFAVAGTLFLTGTIAAALAPSFAILLAGRLVQGCGTGIALPLMFNIILEQVPAQNLGTMMGVGNLVTAVAPAVGPSFGGFLVTHVGWRAVFTALVPLVCVALLAGTLTIRQVATTQRSRFDACGMAFLTLGFAAFIFGMNAASSAGWTSPTVLAPTAVAIIAIALFCRHALRTTAPLLRVTVFRSPVFALCVAIILFIQLGCLGLGFLIPNLSQLSLGMDALESGLLLVPGCIIGACISPVSGQLLDRMSAKVPLVAGSAFLLLSTTLFALLAHSLSTPLMICLYVLFTLGQGLCFNAAMTNGISRLPETLRADGNAVMSTAQQLAGAVGTVLVSTIVAAAQLANPADLSAATLAGSQQAFAFVAGLFVCELLCAGAVFLLFRNRALGEAA